MTRLAQDRSIAVALSWVGEFVGGAGDDDDESADFVGQSDDDAELHRDDRNWCAGREVHSVDGGVV